MLKKLLIKAGLCSNDADYTAGPRWVRADKVRFWKGFPQKIGGWTKYTTSTFSGICRAILGWRTIAQENTLALGTHQKLYIYQSSSYTDITPIRTSGTLSTDPITTTSGSTAVSIAHTSHGLAANDIIILDGATAVGGITVDGEYTVTSITDPNTYVVTHGSAATSSATGGGAAVTYQYLITVGQQHTSYQLGWGASTFGTGTWGTARSVSGLISLLRTWSLGNWGEDLIANPHGQGVYFWDASVGIGTRATVIANAPTSNHILVTTHRTVVALGCTPSGSSVVDPLFIRWSDIEDYTQWTPASSNSSGTHRIGGQATEIIGGVETKNEILVFTDAGLHSMRFTETEDVYNIDHIGDNCGLIGPNAAVDINSVVYWASKNSFFKYDGTILKLDCPVHDEVFGAINKFQGGKVVAGQNPLFGEVIWLYQGAGSENDSYVIYNYLEDTWATGTLDRTCWVAGNDAIGSFPVAIDASGQLYNHEDGTDNVSSAITAYIESGEFELEDGEHLSYLDKLIFDGSITGSVDFTIKTRRYPQGSETTKGPYTVSGSTAKTSFRARGRQFAIRWESDATGDHWRLGNIRINIKPGGRR